MQKETASDQVLSFSWS